MVRRASPWLGGVLLSLSMCSGVASSDAQNGSDASADAFASARKTMVDEQLRARDIVDERVLRAMGTVPRHRFVPPDQIERAYEDGPLPIGWNVTISQPYIVALMTQLADVQPGERVLDVGTGSGYQAAVLAEMGAKVHGIEIIEPLAKRAGPLLKKLGYEVDVVHGDGWKGRPEHAPYDAIILAAAPSKIPRALKEQLAVGGRLVLPVGAAWSAQALTVVTRTKTGFTEKVIVPVAFVPMTGGAHPDPAPGT